MTTRSRTLLIAAIVVAAYIGASWLIGIVVQSQLESREQKVLKQAPYLVLIHREYHRGIFGASEQATYGLTGPFAQLARVLPTAEGDARLHVTVRNTIRHGPLPGLRTIALATVETELTPPAELAQRLSAVAGGRPLIAVHTRLDWSGGSSTELSSPAFRMPLQQGAVLSSSGFDAHVEATRDQASWTGHGTSAGFAIQGPGGRAAFGGLSFDAAMRRAVDPLYLGDFRFRITGMQFQSASSPPVQVNGLTFTGTSAAHGGYVDSGVDLTADEVKTASVAMSHVEYALRFEHLQTASLASLSAALRTAQLSAAPGNPAAATAAVRDAFVRYGTELLLHDAVVEIPRSGFAMPEGEMRLQARLAAPGIRREDLSGSAALTSLASHLDATAELRIDAALLTKLVGGSPRGPALSAQLDALQRQGYLKRDGTAWTASAVYRAGKLTINGQAFPPTAAHP